jgi:O-Antigen ligase/Tetratricopeptide repeat
MDAALRRFLIAAVGAGCGLSPAFYGYFDISVWGPIALGLIVFAVGLLVARPALPTGLAAIALGGVVLFAVWSLLSMGWAESADRALTEGDRWILHAVFLLVMVLLIADRRDGEVFLLAATAGIVCIGAWEMAKMLTGDGASLFGATRLLEPLGYVNGLGGYFLLGFWPLFAVAERARSHALAALAAGGATLLACLVLLTESRGTLFAFVASAVLLLLLFPGRGGRAWLLLVFLGGIAISWGPVTDVTEPVSAAQFAPPDDAIRRGAEWIVVAALAVAFVWGVGRWAVDTLRDTSDSADDWLPRISVALLCGVAACALTVALVAVNDPVERVSDQYDAFTDLEQVETGSRLTAGGGNRYDYWRIAWDQFTDEPIKGIGAGNFDRTYFLERSTREDVRQAHSLELQTLGDTGIVGALMLGAFLVAVIAGIFRRAGAARGDPSELLLGVAASGVFVVWLAQTSVDWLHLIPGITGIALGASAILLLRPGRSAGEGPRPLPLLPLAAAAVALAVVAIVFIGRPTLAQHYRSEAQDELRSDPREALDRIDDSLSLNPEAPQGYYVKSAAFARLDDYRAARRAMGEAIEREPHNYVSWALLGDLATRRGEIEKAIAAYRRASELNPRDPELRVLATRRGLVERLHRDPEAVGPLVEAASLR